MRKMMMHGIASRVGTAADQHHVTNLQRAHLRLSDGRLEAHFAAGSLEARLIHHRDRGH